MRLILPDNVSAERVPRDTRDQLNINLVPALHRPVWPIPVCEEGGDCARFVVTLDAGNKLSVLEGLSSLDLSTSPGLNPVEEG